MHITKLTVFLLFFLVLIQISYAVVPDSDLDGVPDENDKCPGSDSYAVDRYGCTCAQKDCPSDSNECTDDCSVIDGFSECTYSNNNKPCQNGFCKDGRCDRINHYEENKKKCISSGFNWCAKGTGTGSHVENGYLDYGDFECWTQCTTSGNGMSPSGIVQSTGDPTWITLKWPKFEGAIHYNVRLDDGTSDRADDPRFETCPSSPHYYCENSIESTFIDGVPVKPGRKYNFWIDPVIPEKNYFNINVQFEVSAKKTASTASSDDTDSDFVITSQAAISTSDNIGPQKTIVILAGIGSEMAPVDVATANKGIFGNEFGSANDYYIKNSYGKASLAGKVVGPYTLPSNSCDLDSIRDEAIKAANPQVNFLEYSRILLVVSSTSCFPLGGYGLVGKSEIDTPDGKVKASVSWIGQVGLHVVSHELGHNFGLLHAGSKQCSSCEPEEYGDRFDIMGTGEMHINSVYKEIAGWPSNTMTATQGEYLLKPIEIAQPAGAIQHIKLPLGNSFYSLEFRQPINYDAGAPGRVYSGVFIRHIEKANPVSLLINFDSWEKTPLLQAGQTYRGPNQQDYEILLKSADSNGATVQVKPYTRTNFISLTYPKGEETWEIGSTKTIQWENINIPSDNKIEFIKLRKLGQEGSEHILFTEIMNDGAEPWEVTLLPGIYRVEIQTRYNDEILSDISGKFDIVSTKCIDTDKGINYFVKGGVYQKYDSTFWEDGCLANSDGGAFVFSGDYVIETYCREDGDSGNEIYKCPNKCAGGRCNQPLDPNQPSVKITSPKKGDVWNSGSTHQVEWSWYNVDDGSPISADSLISVNLTDAAGLGFNMHLFTEKISNRHKDFKVPDSIKPGEYRLIYSGSVFGGITDFFEIRKANSISGSAIAELKPQNMQEVEGVLEVLHVDDFENPENSRYIHFIVLDNKKYEIKSEEKLPVVLSGSKAKIKGLIIGEKFLLENYIKAHPEEINEKQNIKTAIPKGTKPKRSQNLALIIMPLIGICAATLGYFVFRKRD